MRNAYILLTIARTLTSACISSLWMHADFRNLFCLGQIINGWSLIDRPQSKPPPQGFIPSPYLPSIHLAWLMRVCLGNLSEYFINIIHSQYPCLDIPLAR